MDLNVSKSFLEMLYGDMLEDAFFNIFTIPKTDETTGKNVPGKMIGRWLKTDDVGISSALQFTDTWNKSQNVYFGVGLSDKPYKDTLRLKSTGKPEEYRLPSGIIGLWADMDVVKTKSKKRYPTSVEKARAIAYATGLNPTLIVESGGGIHAYWLFKEIWFFDNDAEREKARELSRRWQSTIQKKAYEQGFEFDSIYDLERIMRLPGTINHNNGKPVTSRIMEQYESRRYDIGDFEGFIDELDEKANKPVKAERSDNFNIREDAKPPFEKLEALRENVDDFEDVWTGKKKFKKGDSQSERDLSLVNFFVRAEWSDQEIVDTLVYYRIKNQIKPKARQYYERTIGRVRATIQDDDTIDELMELDTEEIAADSETQAEAKDRIKEAVFNTVSGVMKFEVTRMVKYVSEPPTYTMETSKGRIDFGGVGNLVSPTKFKEKVYEAVGVAVSIKADVLARVLTLLTQATDLIDLGAEATRGGQLKGLLDDYLEKKNIQAEENFQQAAFEHQPARKEGIVYIFLNDFIKFLRNDHFETPDKTEIVKQFAIMGITSKTVKARNPRTEKTTTRSAFAIPESWEV